MKGYAAIGHAGFAEEGGDIVCAGVSALTQSAVNALEKVAKLKPTVLKRPGFLMVRVEKATGLKRRDAQVILKSCASGVSTLARQYPEYVRVKWKIER